jgi:hypothetical protein
MQDLTKEFKMFVPLPHDKMQDMKENGMMKFFVYQGWEFVAASAMFTTIPHKVAYVRKGQHYGDISDNYLWVFDCKFTLDKHSLMIEELIPHTDETLRLSKAMEYTFLSLTVEEAEKMAILSRKPRLYIASPISTFSEIVSEAGFSVKQIKFTNSYKAQKIIDIRRER